MHKSTTLFSAALALALAPQIFAGGFWLTLGNPEASPEARAMKAVLTVKAADCRESSKPTITGTAISIVNGRRQTIPLKLTPLSEPGMFAVTQQWPVEGRWVLQFVGSSQDRFTSALVHAGPNGIDRLHAKLAMTRPTPEEVDAFWNAATPPESIAQK